MTVWILQQNLTLDEEKEIFERTELVLPFDDLPDLSGVYTMHECQNLLRTLYPDAPPESIMRQSENIWSKYSNLYMEDTVAVPLPRIGKVALAQITGPYQYRVSVENPNERHVIPIKWYPKMHLFFAFGRQRHIFVNLQQRLYEVKEHAAIRAIHNKLPFGYNRFSGWKWLWIWGIIGAIMVMRLVHRLGF